MHGIAVDAGGVLADRGQALDQGRQAGVEEGVVRRARYEFRAGAGQKLADAADVGLHRCRDVGGAAISATGIRTSANAVSSKAMPSAGAMAKTARMRGSRYDAPARASDAAVSGDGAPAGCASS